MSKKIVNKLNNHFSNESELIDLCNSLSNEPQKVLEMISKIIKYAFVHKEFLNNQETLQDISKKITNIDIEYQKYLNKKSFPLFMKKSTIDNEISSMLDKDIRLTDIQGIRIPTIDKIDEICQNNQKRFTPKKPEKHFKEQRGFELEGFTYTRCELLTITPTFRYDYQEATGNLEIDFDTIYQDDRYINRQSFMNPLNNSYEKNIQKIKSNTSITLKKEGNVYDIKNGRHRILYIMKHGIPVEIPITITRRIEDKEFNEILCILKEKYNAKIYKNNLTDDNPNILISINQMAYVIKNKDELISFYKNLRNKTKGNYFNFLFNLNQGNNIATYENMIYQKYLEIGSTVLTSNFTDLFQYFGELSNQLYIAFQNLQQLYLRSVVYQIDFKTYYENQKNAEKNKRLNTEEWTKIMSTPHKR